MNTDFEVRRHAALKLLEATGMRRSNYLPPAMRLLWRLGAKLPPPHFAGFAGAALVSGAVFANVWGAFMWLFVWRTQGLDALVGIAVAAIAGTFMGLAMAFYYARGRKKHQLPPWRSLGA